MKHCEHCGKEIRDEAVICVHCGKTLSKPACADKLACIVSVFCPLLGFILFATNEQTRPDIAKTYLWCAVIPYILVLIASIILGIVGLVEIFG